MDTKEKEILSQYFYDLYGIFMKKLSVFVLADESEEVEGVKLKAMLSEMVRVKAMMAGEKL